MAEVKVNFDRMGNTLTVWFDDPAEEYVCEETADEVALMKNSSGTEIGFEKLNYTPRGAESWRVAFETASQ